MAPLYLIRRTRAGDVSDYVLLASNLGAQKCCADGRNAPNSAKHGWRITTIILWAPRRIIPGDAGDDHVAAYADAESAP